MKTKYLIVYALLLLFAAPVSVQASAPKHKPRTAARVRATIPVSHELQEMLRRTWQIAAAAQTEAQRAREQNEELQRRLESNTRELAQLRQAMTELGAQMTELKSDKAASKLAVAQPEQKILPAPSEQSEQSTIRHPPSAIVERLDRLQEQVEVNTEQIREHAQTKVESDARFRVKLSGMILANTWINTNDSSLNDVPLVAPAPGTNLRKNNFGASLRQTRIGLTMNGPRLSQRLGEARVSAEAEFDFWGDNGDVLGSLRVITASARLDWERTALVIGQRQPLVSPLNPTSLAAVWFAPLTAAGNLWQWRPQIMLEHRARLGDSSELIAQGGVLMPFGESLANATIEGGPGYETRLALRRNLATDRSLEIGFGGYLHRRPFSFGRNVTSYALTSDWIIPLGNRLEISGEAYFGKAISLGEASGGRNDRQFIVTGLLDDPATRIGGVHSAGGWAQLAVKARPGLDFNFAVGEDDPRNRDLRDGVRGDNVRFRNQVASANFIWQLRANFLVSLEYRRIWTNYATKQQTNGHYNLAVGYVF